MIDGTRILLIISGGIAAYKALELIRLLRRNGALVRCILTEGGSQFITPLSVAALSEQPVYTDLWSLKDETEMGHIRLSRESDLIVIAPASASLMARMAHGLADDLAATVLLASDKPVIACPAMNPAMWSNPATQYNISVLKDRGVRVLGPASGEMACGETGEGRLLEPQDILAAIGDHFSAAQKLRGKKAVVTAGPTYEPIDPVRFIGNRSSGKQGYAIACALRDAGASVTLITGPSALQSPKNIKTVRIETASQMLAECQKELPADIFVSAAAVSDWAPEKMMAAKIKKVPGTPPPALRLTENPDILATVSRPGPDRPALVIGFAAETGDLTDNARRKLARKGCDWIVANDVGQNGVFGGDHNQIVLLTPRGMEEWEHTSKEEIARRLVSRIIDSFKDTDMKEAAE